MKTIIMVILMSSFANAAQTVFTQSGDEIHGSDGSTYTQVGNQIHGSDGSTTIQIGDQTIVDDGKEE